MVSIFQNILIYISFYFLIIKCKDKCDRHSPIFNTQKGNCFLEYCTQSQFDDGTCIIGNSLAKITWLNSITTISTSSNSEIFPNVAFEGSDQNLILETDIGKNKKLFYSLGRNGRGYNNEPQFFYLEKKDNNFLYNNYHPQSYIRKIDSHRIYYSFSSNESFFTYDLESKNYTEDILENILGNKILSTYNSIMTTEDEDIIIYAYLTTDYKITFQKLRLLSNGIEVIQTKIDDTKSLPRDSCKCKYLIREAREYSFIECISMNEDQDYTVRAYRSNLTFYDEITLQKNEATKEEAYYSFNDIVVIYDQHVFFMLYFDSASKPMLYPKRFYENKLINIDDLSENYVLFKDYSYSLSSTGIAVTKLSEMYFILANICDNNKHLMIVFFLYYNFDVVSLYINYIDVPIKDLYDINYFSSLYLLDFNNLLGLGFIQEKNNEYINSFLLFSYSNYKSDIFINDIFLNFNQTGDILHSENLSENITLYNNLFCYEIRSINIISVPDENSGFEIRTFPTKTLINRATQIQLDENVTISYVGNFSELKPGNYEIIYSPEIIEASSYDKYIGMFDKWDYYGVELLKSLVNWVPDTFPGRESKLIFSVLECYKSCLFCNELSTDDYNHKCKKCRPGYYFEENTLNCYDKPRKGYYFNKNRTVFSKCYEICETCDEWREINKHHCTSCKSDYLLYNSTNCLRCKQNNLFVDYNQEICLDRIPVGYYLNNTEYNTLDKCHPNCMHCLTGPEGDNMKCEYCDNLEKYYHVENTQNCQHFPYEGYYLAENLRFRPCHPYCKNCTIGPNEESMNCDYCNTEKGYFKNVTDSRNCVFKLIENFYYVEENDSYLPCYENCLYCFDGEKKITNNDGSSYLLMNCLICKNNYTLFGRNCLNCKSQNKFVNMAKTDCIDTIPEGYFLSNETTNEIDQCFPLCKTCREKGTNNNNMKCDSCNKIEKYFLLDENCVLSMTCPSFFYYKNNLILNNTNETYLDEEKNCLNDKEDCPYTLPFYLKDNLECTNSCSIDLILENKCFIANFEAGLNQIFDLIYDKYSNGSFDFFDEIFSYVYKDKDEFIIKIKFFEFDGKNETNSTIINESIKRIDDWGNLNLGKIYEIQEQEINLEQCLEFLQIKNISNNDTNKLFMTKIYIKNINSNISNYYFQLFIDNNGTQKIDLSTCHFDDTNNFLILNINDLITQKKEMLPKITDQEKTDEKEEEQNEGYDNTYTYKKFNNDKCAVVYNENDADVILEDRVAVYYQQLINNVKEETNRIIDTSISSNNRILNDLTEETTKIITTSQISEIYNTKTFIQIPINEICPINYKLVNFDFDTHNATCSYIFNFQDMINGINIIKLIEENTYMNKTFIEIEIEEEEHMDSTNQNTNTDNINNNGYTNSNVNSKVSTEISSGANIKYMKCITNISKQFKNNYVLIILTILDILYLACIILYFACYRKKYLQVIEKTNNMGILGIKGSYYHSYKLDQNQPKLKEIRTYKKNMFSSINSDIQSINNNVNVNNNINNNINIKNKNMHNVKNKKTMISEELTNRQYISNANFYYKNTKNNSNDKKDYDLSEYLLALEKDKRNIKDLFISISKKKHIYILALKSDHYIKLLKLSLLPFCFVNYFTTNVFFFTDKVIHQIYLDKGSYNFSYQLKFICLSALISSIFLYIGKYIFIIKKSDKQIKRIIKIVDFAFVLIFLLFVFYWLYVGSYTSVFIKSQKHISFNFLLTIITCAVYEIILTIISVILRIIAIKENLPTLYKISIILILLKA